MLSTSQCHGDLYDSYHEPPIEAHSFSTERKVVRKGEGPLLQRFLQEPVHTSPDRTIGPIHSLPMFEQEATPWFDAMGHYAPPSALNLDDEAAAFAFDDITLWRRLKASWSRGPDNAIVNIANLPIELFG